MLPESRRARRRGASSAVISAATHIGIIAAVAYASGAEPPAPPEHAGPEVEVVYRNVPQSGDERPAGPRLPSPGDATAPPIPKPTGPIAVPPIDVPSTLPPIGEPLGELFTRDSASLSPRVSTTGGRPGSGADTPLPNEYVDTPALAREDNPAPRYPEMLRAAGVAGSVTMRFVIDTAGRVIMRTVEARHSDHELFSAAVRAALLRSRFLPAEANGRKVPVLVEQRFEFRLER